MPNIEIRDCPPDVDGITPYDELHLVTYLRLLDADEEGADWHEVMQVVFEIDPDRDPAQAERIHQNHLARAKWMTTNGYKHLLAMQK